MDEDGGLDVEPRFRNLAAGIACDDAAVSLAILTLGGQAMSAADAITVTRCR